MIRPAESSSDRSLRSWGDQLRSDRLSRRKRLNRTCLVGLGCALLAETIVMPPAPRLLWNASASAPIGLYVVRPGAHLTLGDTIVARLPVAVQTLAATRHYLPLGVPLVKHVAAGPGDTICASAGTVFVNGRSAVIRQAVDHLGRPMPAWTGCQVLHDGQYLLLMPKVASSFDGRYFGITNRAEIIGTARLLWAR